MLPSNSRSAIDAAITGRASGPATEQPSTAGDTGIYDAARRELNTVRDLVRFAVSQFVEQKLFFGHGSSNAYDEAVYLVLHSLHLPLDHLEPFLDARLTGAERDAVLGIIERRVRERIPAAYLTQQAWLGDYKFYVDKRVIVPRSFIAELLREDLAPWVENPRGVGRVLDLCTGSGCLAILAALSFPHATVDAVDASYDALEVAKKNIRDYGLDDRINLVASDMYESLGAKHYDIIISNPPYVSAESMGKLPEEYRREPEMALASGEDGLDHVRALIANATKHLYATGLLVVEVGFNREGVERAFPNLPLVWAETSVGDEVVFIVDRETLVAAQ
ncbi:MAG: 50S ribosomal protein L3 N(5)-glutamine methyltransferase [Rhodocyclaceae bacterium]|jgi:ribosomal protein L3 glutamine methyltransferase|nr:50S ribosomal protein L3 N(5)-glutamine methyltransferase [Rhodocyclaceae bacterium]MCA3019010.1 50S ribosomal protein L3 N(5)-glutamine methyltransferase [Rhodocyclaceae bacterium]MCA3022139.1 50S ribosomal protein L3 N(5)-glutamine methyltransferase [Rhodocyclaceae bacterium]MCA3024367.1 50S ribosomal protein L3 N(5)-glutamine methyltransferase [Rhodocyclaceae bacterium]MCA3030034.1 50S ribosomal protein L3 N(5)-glutamine methyltransferase [Rhodocyclaceae bacterium]